MPDPRDEQFQRNQILKQNKTKQNKTKQNKTKQLTCSNFNDTATTRLQRQKIHPPFFCEGWRGGEREGGGGSGCLSKSIERGWRAGFVDGLSTRLSKKMQET